MPEGSMATLLVNGRVSPVAGEAQKDVWVPLASLERQTGWALKPEGACFGERCVPIPQDRADDFVSDQRFNMTALASHLGQPVLRDAQHEVVAIGESSEGRANRLRTLEAPDFTLPDIDGAMHSLSDFRGRKVFLASWASW
jgi:hypothetical protein